MLTQQEIEYYRKRYNSISAKRGINYYGCRKALTEAQIFDAITMYLYNEPVEEIASYFNISTSTFYNYLRDSRVEKLYPGCVRFHYDPNKRSASRKKVKVNETQTT